MPGKMRVVSPTGRVEGSVAKAEASPKNIDDQAEQLSISDAASEPKPGGRPWRRRLLFALLPLVLIGGRPREVSARSLMRSMTTSCLLSLK